MKPVRFLQSARADIRTTKTYYRKLDPELASKFQNTVESGVQAISHQPMAMQIQEFNVRRWPLEAFPHGILYRIEQDAVLILAVFHPKQSPETWRHRMQN